MGEYILIHILVKYLHQAVKRKVGGLIGEFMIMILYFYYP